MKGYSSLNNIFRSTHNFHTYQQTIESKGDDHEYHELEHNRKSRM